MELGEGEGKERDRDGKRFGTSRGLTHAGQVCSTSEPAPSEFLAMAWEGQPYPAPCSLADTQLRLALLYCIWPAWFDICWGRRAHGSHSLDSRPLLSPRDKVVSRRLFQTSALCYSTKALGREPGLPSLPAYPWLLSTVCAKLGLGALGSLKLDMEDMYSASTSWSCWSLAV